MQKVAVIGKCENNIQYVYPKLNEDYPLNALKDIIPNINTSKLHKDYKGTFEYLLSTSLNSRQVYALRLRYMFGYTLIEIGDILGVTKERARQIVDRTIEKMHKVCSGSLFNEGIAGHVREKVSEQLEDVKESYTRILDDKLGTNKNKEEVISLFADDMDYADIRVEDMGLSVRVRNALLSDGITTLYDVMNMSDSDCYGLHSFGKTCAIDIIRKVEPRFNIRLDNFREAYGLVDYLVE